MHAHGKPRKLSKTLLEKPLRPRPLTKKSIGVRERARRVASRILAARARALQTKSGANSRPGQNTTPKPGVRLLRTTDIPSGVTSFMDRMFQSASIPQTPSAKGKAVEKRKSLKGK